MKTDTQEIIEWMFANYEPEIDPRTGELSCTHLAERAAQALDLHEEDGSIGEEVFEAAFDVYERLIDAGRF